MTAPTTRAHRGERSAAALFALAFALPGVLGGTDIAFLIGAIMLLSANVMLNWWVWTNDYAAARAPAPTRHAAIGSLTAAVFITMFETTRLGVSLELAAPIACGYAGLAFVALRYQVSHYADVRVHRPLLLADAADASELVDDCRAQLRAPGLADTARMAVELNLAQGLIMLSMLSDSYDSLPDAQQIIERTLSEAKPGWVVAAAMSLADAMMVKAHRCGDLDGLREALDVAVTAASAPPRRLEALAIALAGRSDGMRMLSDRAEADGDTGHALRLYAEAVSDLEHAVSLAWGRRSLRARLTIQLAAISWGHPQRGDLDASIERCRWALRRLRWRRLHAREAGCLALADLLRIRARRNPVLASSDLREAIGLCELFVERGRRRHQALWQLAGLLDASGAEIAVVGETYRRAFEAQSAFSLGGASRLAAEWATWASGGRYVEHAAEAHWCWIGVVVEEARRRVVRSEQERELSHVQGLAADAAYWLVRASRTREAAVALDLGRALQLTQRMSRRHVDLEQRLVAAGRADLAGRWSDVARRVASADRGAYATERQGLQTTLRLGARSFQARFSTQDQQALADHERLMHEIGRLAGFEDLAAAPGYDDLRQAAQAGPVAYLVAGGEHGFAIVVDGASSEPQVALLEGLTTASVAWRARRLAEAADALSLADEVVETLGLLWTHLMAPLTAALPAAGLVTLVPVGALSLLPVHAAGIALGTDGAWTNRTDGLVFRYAPNARVLLRAEASARGMQGDELAILTVDVPHAPGLAPLEDATTESRTIAALFGSGGLVRRPRSRTIDDVLDALDSAAIWHFACHATHRSDEPLDSCLHLEDGPLTLKALFGRPAGRQRLAVLSACQTSLPSQMLLDEVVSFPSAMLQAGVAGVVSTLTVVDDRASMLLVLRFFVELRGGAHPAHALAAAQAWLRSATNGEIHDAFGAAHAPPPKPHDDIGWALRREFDEPHRSAMFSFTGA
jgi:CHAT domain-containing protein